MNKIERIDAVIANRQPDRVPLSFWHHFAPDEAAGPAAVAAHLRLVAAYDVDFLKVMDDNRYPRFQLPTGVVRDAADLERLVPLRGEEDSFGRQLELLGELEKRLGDSLYKPTTVFNAWTTLRNLLAPDTGVHGPPVLGQTGDRRDEQLGRFVREAPAALVRALAAITESTARFVGHCLDAGADGIYLSVRDDWVEAHGRGLYDKLVRDSDRIILDAAARGRFNILHVCGTAVDFDRFAHYPAQALSWADRSAGPSIAEAAPRVKAAICAGLDNLGTLKTGTPDQCVAQARDALRQAGPRPMILAPGCTFDPGQVPKENLFALRQAVDSL